ncbi:MAG TPA: hypothetical protein VFN38_06720 [Gemmatimonadaceae bacterium]|nr:hypothetical protein [Gemmatimonadaceae bacterium]
MTRSRKWLVAAWIFTAINVLGIGPALYMREGSHTLIHVVLALLGMLAIQRLSSGGSDVRLGGTLAGRPSEISDRLTNLEQSVDAVAIEIERVGEGQRFMTRFFTEQGLPRTPANAEPPKPGPPPAPSRHQD